LPRVTNIELNGAVLLFTVCVSLIATFLAGVAPALRASMTDPQSSIREGARSVTSGRRPRRLRSALVVTEVALAVLLIAGAGLMIRSFRTLTAVEPGFDATNALMADLSLPSGDYDSARVVFAETEMLERMAALPGISAAAITTSLPLFETPGNYDFDIRDRPPPSPGQPATSGDFIAASPGLLDALRINLVRGRWLEAGDREGSLPVAVVNQTAARMFWPDGDVIGRQIRMGSTNNDLPWLTIVGVVDDVKYSSLASDFRPAWYAPVAQMSVVQGSPVRSITFVLRASDTGAAAAAVRRVVTEFDPNLPIGALNTVEGVLRESLAGPRFVLTLLTLFATLALILGSIGLYGVLSYAVSERAHELGLRMALGARRGALLRNVAGKGIALAMTGVAIGVPAALVLSRFMKELLFETSPTDARTFVGVALTMLLVAAVASLVPAMRAIRMDPLTVLRR
jgi:predicted permease